MDFFIFSLFRRFEAFLICETSGRKRAVGLFLIFALMIPGSMKFLFIFALSAKLLPSMVADKKMRFFLSLPFSRTELFIYSFLLGFSLIFATTAIGWSLFDRSSSPEFLKYFIFYAFYFGLTLIYALKIGLMMLLPMLVLLFDLVSPFVTSEFFAISSQFSPIYQQNQQLSLAVSLAVLAISYVMFVFGRGEKW
ncbi:hypothetical protein J6W78_00510 [bacterium]|nr:hypothetical protein [bacterium]